TTWDVRILWELAISEMDELVSLWDWIQRGNRVALSQYIQWEDSRTVWYRTWPDLDPIPGSGGDHGNAELIFSADRSDQVLELLTPGDVVMPALFYVQRRINGWIEAGASPRLHWDAASSRMELKFVPGSLLAALWVQFARAVEGNR